MMKTNEAILGGILGSAQDVAERMLKEHGGLVPFGISCWPDGRAEKTMAGDGVMEALGGDTGVLLKYEALLNAGMRRRATQENVGALGLATRRDTAAGPALALQIEFEDRCIVLLLPYRKRMLGGWSFEKPVALDERFFPPPQSGKTAHEPGELPYRNAFAPSPEGDGFVHRASGLRFPSGIAGYEIANLMQHDAFGLDIAFAYNHTQLEALAVTVFVYPGEQAPAASLDAHFEKCKGDIVSMHGTARVLFEDRAQLAGDRNGKLCVYRLKDRIEGRDIESVSELWLFPFEERFLKYRASYDPALRTSAPAAVKALVESLAWPQSQPSTARAADMEVIR